MRTEAAQRLPEPPPQAPAPPTAIAAPVPVLRDAERTRKAILDAATTEFALNGLAGARVDRIAEVSGANKRMIYYYFHSKDDLYLAVLEEAYTAMRASERDLKPLDAIRKLVEFKFDYIVTNPSIIWLLNGENMLGAKHLKRSTRLTEMHVSLVRTLSGILAAGAADGTIRPGVDPLHLYISISGVSYFFFANTPTLTTAFGKDLNTAAARKARRAHVVDVILSYVAPPR
jgi:TetR/AcrR family transcriptional regulator